MRTTLTFLRLGGLAAAILLSGCTGQYQSDFAIVVANKTVNTIQVLANGNALGQVVANQTGSFSLHLSESNSNILTNGVTPTAQAQVTLTAKDMRTGLFSTEKSVTLSGNSPTSVTFAAADFPSTGPTIAVFVFSPTAPGINSDVVFNGSRSSGSNLTYAWDFGDGQVGTGVTATHQYARQAQYTVVLTVTNDTGSTGTTSQRITVSANFAPQAVTFAFSPNSPVAINQTVVFTAIVTNVSGATYTWDFGDGATGVGPATTHQYTRAANFNVTLRVTSDTGQTATAQRALTVSATSAQVVANFTMSPTTPGINDDVFFNAAASTPSNATFTWDFGDGSRGAGVTTTHRYSRAATFTVTMTVTNDLGQSSTRSATITVSTTSSQVVARFTFSPTTPSVGDDVFFNATSSTATNGTGAWDFGDGTRGTGGTPTHQYARAATYTVTLTVTNDLGQSATTSLTVPVSAGSIAADFTFSPTAPRISTGTNTVIFDATPSSASVTGWTWDFGDGTPGAAGKTTTHPFSVANTWVVRLTVTDAAGRTATKTQNVTVVQ